LTLTTNWRYDNDALNGKLCIAPTGYPVLHLIGAAN